MRVPEREGERKRQKKYLNNWETFFKSYENH